MEKGYSQEYGIDYEETFSLVARMTFVGSLLAVVSTKQWPFLQMDVKNAFLNVTLSKEVYMKSSSGTSRYFSPTPKGVFSPSCVIWFETSSTSLACNFQLYHH